ncbi:MAG: hypothetical protein KY455_03690 [Euryarchaeota archaeon]|nr:hypothetical protein [Euryarchaeota archaeon]
MDQDRPGDQIGLFIFGGAFLGFWLILTLTTRPDWFWWGLVGIGIGLGLAGGKMLGNQARYLLWTLVGLSIGGLVGLAFMQPHPALIATLITLAGSAFIAGALPTNGRAPATAADVGVGSRPQPTDWQANDASGGTGQSQGSQQQSVTVVRGR